MVSLCWKVTQHTGTRKTFVHARHLSVVMEQLALSMPGLCFTLVGPLFAFLLCVFFLFSAEETKLLVFPAHTEARLSLAQ